jgi:hypothetical protein
MATPSPSICWFRPEPNPALPLELVRDGQNNWFSPPLLPLGQNHPAPPLASCMPLPGVVPGSLRPVGARPTPAPWAVGGAPFAVFSCCVGPVGAQNPICFSITEYVPNNTPCWANVRAPLPLGFQLGQELLPVRGGLLVILPAESVLVSTTGYQGSQYLLRSTLYFLNVPHT